MMLRVLLVVSLVAFVSAEPDFRSMFSDAMDKYAEKDGLLRSEPPEVVRERYRSFVKFAKMVEAINADSSLTFNSENNFLSILTDEEKMGHLGMNITGHEHEDEDYTPMLSSDNLKIAKSRDFRHKISPIKDQGNCGSCWTYAATAALEGEIYFTTGTTKTSLSEQEYMECSTSRDGCNGGWMKDCYTYSVRTGRIAPESAYPYEEKDTRRCRAEGKANALKQTNTKITGNIPIKGGDSALLKYANSHIVSVAISVVNSFYGYKNGLYNERKCPNLNHAVAVVGYQDDHWLVRNSWGASWGDKGYIKMSRKVNNICGISDHDHIPAVECADNSCQKPDFEDEEGEEEEEKEEEEEEENDGGKMCEQKSSLSGCRRTEAMARKLCDKNNISKEECLVAKIKRCYYVSLNKDVGGSNRITYYAPCGDGDDDGGDDDESNGGCDAAAGLVLCSDCNCCKHKHMCYD